jgi:hypothetical protein
MLALTFRYGRFLRAAKTSSTAAVCARRPTTMASV